MSAHYGPQYPSEVDQARSRAAFITNAHGESAMDEATKAVRVDVIATADGADAAIGSTVDTSAWDLLDPATVITLLKFMDVMLASTGIRISDVLSPVQVSGDLPAPFRQTVDGAMIVSSRDIPPHEAGISLVYDGRQTVTTAGTPVQLYPAGQNVQCVSVTAETDNTGTIVIGASTVIADQATRRGTPLFPGDTAIFAVADVGSLYLDSTVNGDGVTWVALSYV